MKSIIMLAASERLTIIARNRVATWWKPGRSREWLLAVKVKTHCSMGRKRYRRKAEMHNFSPYLDETLYKQKLDHMEKVPEKTSVRLRFS